MAEKGCKAESLRDWPIWGMSWQPELITGLGVIIIGTALLLLVPEAVATEPSPVTLVAESESKYVIDGERVYFTISIANTDEENNVTVQMNATFLSGSYWDSEFVADLDDSPLQEVKSPDNVTLPKGIEIPSLENTTIYYRVEAPLDAHNSSPRRIEIRAPLMDYNESGWHEIHGNESGPLNWSMLTLTVTAVNEFGVKVTLDNIHRDGTTKVYQDEEVAWGFTLQNRGWKEDTYSLTGRAYKNGSAGPETGWAFTFAPGNSVTLAGLGSPEALQPLQSQFTVTPPAEALPGDYWLEVLVKGSHPNSTSTTARADAQIPLPDFVIQPGDVTFSHSSAWIDSIGNSQTVTIYATVGNNGGNRDSSGRATEHVDVQFIVEDSDVGGILDAAGKYQKAGSNYKIVYIETLNHGQEETVAVQFRAVKPPEKDIRKIIMIQVLVDIANDPNDPEDVDLVEIYADNNALSIRFLIIRVSHGDGFAPSATAGDDTTALILLLGGVTLTILAYLWAGQHSKDSSGTSTFPADDKQDLPGWLAPPRLQPSAPLDPHAGSRTTPAEAAHQPPTPGPAPAPAAESEPAEGEEK